jgi:soluble P-type ATPase
MIAVEIPGRGRLELRQLALDLNGTLAADGRVPADVIDRLKELGQALTVHVFTADTFRSAASLDAPGIRVVLLAPGAQVEAKAAAVRELGGASTVAIGNGLNDEGMLREAALGIVIIGREGAAVRSLLAADLVVTSIQDGLDLLRFPTRLIASLRTA